MLFNSFEYLVFLPLVAALFFATPHRARWALLLAASCVFYAWLIPKYLLILAFTILVDYCAGRWIERTVHPGRRRWFLGVSLAANLGILSVFKYFNFLNSNLAAVLHSFGVSNPIPVLDMALPIGLSFHTFQAMSYIVEVYRGHIPAERHFGRYALYVMFFPQLVAGPIERPQNILHQLRERHSFDYDRVVSGLRRILWGLVKKVLIADRLGVYVDAVFAHPGQYHGATVALAVYFFAFQIYCDFSGYSDIAVGSARILGFRLMENFRSPYFAADLREFWQRWHISLSTWFRDYLYIPLGGNRGSQGRVMRNLFIVFAVSGLWHGANWNFLVWGTLHGLGVMALTAFAGANTPSPGRRALGVFVTFHFVTFAWIFFRAGSLGEAWVVVRSLVPSGPARWLVPGVDATEFSLMLGGIAFLLAAESYHARAKARGTWATPPTSVRWAGYFTAALALIFLSPFSGKSFIYFQF